MLIIFHANVDLLSCGARAPLGYLCIHCILEMPCNSQVWVLGAEDLACSIGKQSTSMRASSIIRYHAVMLSSCDVMMLWPIMHDATCLFCLHDAWHVTCRCLTHGVTWHRHMMMHHEMTYAHHDVRWNDAWQHDDATRDDKDTWCNMRWHRHDVPCRWDVFMMQHVHDIGFLGARESADLL